MGVKDVILILFLLPNMVSSRVAISNVVTKDTNFYYRQFPTFPSKLVTLEYTVTFNLTNVNHHCGRESCNVILDIYTTKEDKNFQKNCSKDHFGQLKNENLHTPLSPRNGPYRFTTCKMINSGMLHCEGKTSIQDYKPRHYGFSFSYECHISVKPSLCGLLYNFTISGQSNKTQCLGTPQNLSEINCTGFYDYMSLPYMIGDQDMASVEEWASGFEISGGFVSYFLSQSTGGCYEYMKEVFCCIIFPQCDPVEKQVIPLCKEIYPDLYKAA